MATEINVKRTELFFRLFFFFTKVFLRKVKIKKKAKHV